MLNADRRYMADFDGALLTLAVGLAAFGVLEICSVTTAHGMAPGLWRRQLVGVGMGLGLMFLTSANDRPRGA